MGYYYKSSLPFYAPRSRRYTKCFWSKFTAFVFLLLFITSIIYFTEAYKHLQPKSKQKQIKCNDLNKQICEETGKCHWESEQDLCKTGPSPKPTPGPSPKPTPGPSPKPPSTLISGPSPEPSPGPILGLNPGGSTGQAQLF